MADSLWDDVVGIPIEDWTRASTVTQLDWLLWLRDNPMPAPPPEAGDVGIYDFGGKLLRTVRTRG